MKAIVLTYDRYRCLTDHMVRQYRQLWPGHPFTFRIPYQKHPGKAGPEREYIQCPPGIKDTVLTLIDDLDDQEWIYWCIDDKYPVSLDTGQIESVMQWMRHPGNATADGILCCRPRKLRKQKRLTGRQTSTHSGTVLLERKNYKCIWIHQFLRVKVLRHLFESFPDHIPGAKAMDTMKKYVHKPENHRLFTTEDSLAVYGESTARGIITKNCYLSLRGMGLPLPNWHDGKLAETNFHGKELPAATRALRRLLAPRRFRTS